MKSILLIASLLIGISINAQSKRQFAIINTKGEIIKQFNARWASAAYNGRIRVKKVTVINGKSVYSYGFIDEKGNEVIPFEFEDAKEFKGKTTWVKEHGQDKYYQIDLFGARMNDLEFDKIGTFIGGAWKVKLKNNINDSGLKYLEGFVDDYGNLIVDPAKEYFCSAFSDGFLCVGHNDQGYGFLDLEGNIAFDFEKRQTGFTSFYGGMARRTNYDGKMGIINNRRVWVAAPTSLQMSGFSHRDSIITIIYNTRTRSDFGFTDFNYKPIFPQRFDSAHSFKHGFAEVQTGDNWGIINKKGAIVVPMKYNTIYNEADEGYFMASNQKDGRVTETFYFDIDGNPISKIQALSNRPNRHGVFALQAGKDEFYIYNEEGEKVLDVPFKRVQSTLEFKASESTKYHFSEKGVAVVQLIEGEKY